MDDPYLMDDMERSDFFGCDWNNTIEPETPALSFGALEHHEHNDLGNRGIRNRKNHQPAQS